jgi:hypothetical protein
VKVPDVFLQPVRIGGMNQYAFLDFYDRIYDS